MGVCTSALYSALVKDLGAVLTEDKIRFILDDTARLVWPDASYEEHAAVAILRSFYKKFVDATSKDADAKALRLFSEVNERCRNHNLQPASERMAELIGTLKRNVYEFFYPTGGSRDSYQDDGDLPPCEGSCLPTSESSSEAYPCLGRDQTIDLGRVLAKRPESSLGGRPAHGSLCAGRRSLGGSEPTSGCDKAGLRDPGRRTGSQTCLIESLRQIASYGSTGPGSSNGSRGTDFYTKLFDGPLGCSSSTLYKAYRDYVSDFPIWLDAENRRRDRYGEAHVVRGNKLYFVPKNDSISRTICAEPVLNMFFQLGLGKIVEGRLRQAFGIDLSTQPFKNRELARLGSLDESYVTIDLSSASDSLAIGMLEQVVPRDQLSWFKLLRSPVSELPDGGELELQMLSTMGNGYTFPLQTMLFSCVVAAAYEWRGLKRVNPYGKRLGNWAVFGDDIIVKREVARDVIDLLELLGFQVNHSKTFLEGPFRESCGADFVRGRPVRGVYIKSLRSPQDRYVAINRLNQWSSDTGIYLPETVGLLKDSVKYLPIPYEENDDAGIKVPSSLIGIRSLCPYTRSLQYDRCVSRAVKMRIKDLDIRTPKGVRRRLYNAEGLLLSFLRGDVKGHTISIRHGAVKYATKRTVCPNWDHRKCDYPESNRVSSSAPVVSPFDTWRRWESAAAGNLFPAV